MNGAFNDGRKCEKLIGRLRKLYIKIDESKEREITRIGLKKELNEIYSNIEKLAEDYFLPNDEIKEITNLYASCVNEGLYLIHIRRLKKLFASEEAEK